MKTIGDPLLNIQAGWMATWWCDRACASHALPHASSCIYLYISYICILCLCVTAVAGMPGMPRDAFGSCRFFDHAFEDLWYLVSWGHKRCERQLHDSGPWCAGRVVSPRRGSMFFLDLYEVIPSRPNHPSSLRNGLGWDFGRADQETPDTSNVDQSLLSMPHISGLFAHNTRILYAQHRWWSCWWIRLNAECTLFQKHMLPFSFINIPHKYLFGFANISGKVLSNISAPCRGTDMSRRRGAGAGCRGPMKANSSRVALEVDRYDVRWYKCVMILLQSQN